MKEFENKDKLLNIKEHDLFDKYRELQEDEEILEQKKQNYFEIYDDMLNKFESSHNGDSFVERNDYDKQEDSIHQYIDTISIDPGKLFKNKQLSESIFNNKSVSIQKFIILLWTNGLIILSLSITFIKSHNFKNAILI